MGPKNKPAVQSTKSAPRTAVMLKSFQRVTDEGMLAHDSDDEDDDAELIQGDNSSCRAEANSNYKR
jgi:hypothetical protein